MLGLNGGLIGVRRTPDVLAAPGMWTPNEQVIRRRAALWPTTSDPLFANVSLLLHCEGSEGSTTFIDSSSKQQTVLVGGGANVSVVRAKFGDSSALFDGAGDYLDINAATIGFAANEDFTLEAWIYPTSLNSYRCIFNTAFSFLANPRLYIKDGALVIFADNADRAFHQTTIQANSWQHVALVRSTGVYSSYLGGVKSTGSWTNQAHASSVLRIGSDNGTLGQDFAGSMDEVRVTKGVARYTANFTPPTAPFPDA